MSSAIKINEMTKIEKKLLKNRKRLAVLNNRLEKLILLNQKYHYTSSFSNEKKINQYYKILVKIRSEKKDLQLKNRELNPNYNNQLKKATSNIVSILNRDKMFNLTASVLLF
jgi:hypothetical protein